MDGKAYKKVKCTEIGPYYLFNLPLELREQICRESFVTERDVVILTKTLDQEETPIISVDTKIPWNRIRAICEAARREGEFLELYYNQLNTRLTGRLVNLLRLYHPRVSRCLRKIELYARWGPKSIPESSTLHTLICFAMAHPKAVTEVYLLAWKLEGVFAKQLKDFIVFRLGILEAVRGIWKGLADCDQVVKAWRNGRSQAMMNASVIKFFPMLTEGNETIEARVEKAAGTKTMQPIMACYGIDIAKAQKDVVLTLKIGAIIILVVCLVGLAALFCTASRDSEFPAKFLHIFV